jgi:AsmA protein
MGKLGKVFGMLVLLVFVAGAGLIAIIHFYLTEERVKALVIPQAESALGRDVAIGDIQIGLLSGITIRDFLIKEADGQNNFVPSCRKNSSSVKYVLMNQLCRFCATKKVSSISPHWHNCLNNL